MDKIKEKFSDLLHKEVPFVLIFASCFSHQSEIKDILRSFGIYAVLSILNDRGIITEGRYFKLDEQQKEVLQKVSDDHKIGNSIYNYICKELYLNFVK